MRAMRTLNRASVTRNALAEGLYLAATSPVHGHYREDTEHSAERAHVH